MSATQSGEVQGLLQQLAGECRHKVEDRRGLLSKAMGQRPLTVTAPPDCPKDLAERIHRHNAAAATWEAAWPAMGEDAAGLALALAKSNVRGAALAEKRAGLVARRYDVDQRLLDLIVDRGEILEAVREDLAPRIAAARADLAKVQEKTEKAILKTGWQSQATLTGGAGRNPGAEAHQLAFEARKSKPVRAATETLAALTTADAQANQALNATAFDREVAQAELLAAWRVLTAGI